MRKYGKIALLETNEIPSAFTSATYGKSYIKQLPMLPLPFDLSGKSDIALRYKQRNKSQQSDHLSGCCSFFSAVNLSYSGKFSFSCHHARYHLSPKGRNCPLAEGGIFTRSWFPDLKRQTALTASGTVPLLSDENFCPFTLGLPVLTVDSGEIENIYFFSLFDIRLYSNGNKPVLFRNNSANLLALVYPTLCAT